MLLAESCPAIGSVARHADAKSRVSLRAMLKLLALLLTLTCARADSVTLTWQAGPGTLTRIVYAGWPMPPSGALKLTQFVDAGAANSVTISGLDAGRMYDFVAIQVDASGNQILDSGFARDSNLVRYTIPTSSQFGPPQSFTVTISF